MRYELSDLIERFFNKIMLYARHFLIPARYRRRNV